MGHKLPAELRQLFLSFIETHSTREFRNSLRRTIFDYIAHDVNMGFHIHFDKFIVALNDLFELLELMEEYRDKLVSKHQD